MHDKATLSELLTREKKKRKEARDEDEEGGEREGERPGWGHMASPDYAL